MATIKVSPMVYSWRVFLFATLVLLGMLVPLPDSVARAASCYGSTCTGLNPQTMGCGADARLGPAHIEDDFRAENRYSVACNAEWERTINTSGGSRYAAGSIRYGCANFCYSWSVTSPAKIANGSQVYTPMIGPDNIIDTKSCGLVSILGPIGIPVFAPCSGIG